MNTDTCQTPLSKYMQRAHKIYCKLKEHAYFCKFPDTCEELYKVICEQYDCYVQFLDSGTSPKFIKRYFKKYYKALLKLYKFEGVKLYEKI